MRGSHLSLLRAAAPLFLAVTQLAVRGVSYTVSTTADSGEGSLRAVIEALNASGGDGVIDLTTVTGDVLLSSALPEIRANVRFQGPETGELRINGQGKGPILSFTAGTTNEVHRLVLTNALATGYRHGAAISNAGTLLLRSCRLVGNRNQFGWGGALYNRGQLTLLDCTLASNTAEGEPGDRASTSGPGGGGGGLGGALFHAEGTLSASNCLFLGNTALGGAAGVNTNQSNTPGSGYGSGRGGGPAGGVPGTDTRAGGFGSGGAAAGPGGFGGGAGGSESTGGFGGAGIGGAFFVRSGSVTLTQCRFEGNVCRGGDGGSGSVAGGGGGDAFGGAGLLLDGELVIEGCEFTGNRAAGATPGGRSSPQGSSPPGGTGEGAALGVHGGILRLTRCLLTNNLAVGGHTTGGRYGSDGGPVHGGGIATRGGAAEIRQSLLVRNRAEAGEGASALFPGDGGEAVGGGIACLGGSTLVENCTLSGNQARGGDAYSAPMGSAGLPGASLGGGIGLRALAGAPLATVRFSTIAENESTRAAALLLLGAFPVYRGPVSGGGVDNQGGTLRLEGSILANNLSDTNADLSGPVVSLCANLVRVPGDATGLQPHDLTGKDPRLGPFTAQGGTSATYSLDFGSPAIDVLPGPDAPTMDQRGKPRPAGSGWDLGAFERQGDDPWRLFVGAAHLDSATHRLKFPILGPPGTSCRVEASTDLVTWDAWGTAATGAEFEDSVGSAPRFYRAVSRTE